MTDRIAPVTNSPPPSVEGKKLDDVDHLEDLEASDDHAQHIANRNRNVSAR